MSGTNEVTGKKSDTKHVSVVESMKRLDEEKKKKQLGEVFDALEGHGYNPVRQLCGYILTGDPIYITSCENARDKIRSFDRFELIELILNDFYRDKINGEKDNKGE